MGDVANDEELYRNVRKSACRIDDEVPQLSSTAFNCPQKKPSVDRASHRTSAAESQKSPSDGIAVLIAEEVRAIELANTDAPPNNYVIDVWARPLPENAAHAQIEAEPDLTGSRFVRLKERLVLLAARRRWVIRPKG